MSYFPRIHGIVSALYDAGLPTYTDLDGNEYSYVDIGSQRWIVENFRCTKFADGTDIPNLTDPTAEELITGWTNVIYETFTSSGKDITSAINTSDDGSAVSNEFSVVAGTEYTISINITLNSGTMPLLQIMTDDGNEYLDELSDGANTIYYTPEVSILDCHLSIALDLVATNFSAVISVKENITEEGRYTAYDNDEDNVAAYGYLYNWHTLANLCYLEFNGVEDTEWRVPSDSDYAALITYLGGNPGAGGKLKETGTTYWKTPNTGATNSSGFTGRPGGYHDDTFYSIQDTMFLWTTTPDGTSAWSRGAVYTTANTFSVSVAKTNYLSVRLVKDI